MMTTSITTVQKQPVHSTKGCYHLGIWELNKETPVGVAVDYADLLTHMVIGWLSASSEGYHWEIEEPPNQVKMGIGRLWGSLGILQTMKNRHRNLKLLMGFRWNGEPLPFPQLEKLMDMIIISGMDGIYFKVNPLHLPLIVPVLKTIHRHWGNQHVILVALEQVYAQITTAVDQELYVQWVKSVSAVTAWSDAIVLKNFGLEWHRDVKEVMYMGVFPNKMIVSFNPLEMEDDFIERVVKMHMLGIGYDRMDMWVDDIRFPKLLQNNYNALKTRPCGINRERNRLYYEVEKERYCPYCLQKM